MEKKYTIYQKIQKILSGDVSTVSKGNSYNIKQNSYNRYSII